MKLGGPKCSTELLERTINLDGSRKNESKIICGPGKKQTVPFRSDVIWTENVEG